MAHRSKRTRRFRIVVVSPRKSETRLAGREVQIAKIAGVLGLTSTDEVVDTAIDLLALATDVATEHGTDRVVLGTTDNLFSVFGDPEE